MKTQIIAPIQSLNKYWSEVMNVFILRAGQEYRPEDLAAYMVQWRQDRLKGPRDSIGFPGANADFVVDSNECQLVKIYNDPKRTPKLMAKAWPAGTLNSE